MCTYIHLEFACPRLSQPMHVVSKVCNVSSVEIKSTLLFNRFDVRETIFDVHLPISVSGSEIINLIEIYVYLICTLI